MSSQRVYTRPGWIQGVHGVWVVDNLCLAWLMFSVFVRRNIPLSTLVVGPYCFTRWLDRFTTRKEERVYTINSLTDDDSLCITVFNSLGFPKREPYYLPKSALAIVFKKGQYKAIVEKSNSWPVMQTRPYGGITQDKELRDMFYQHKKI